MYFDGKRWVRETLRRNTDCKVNVKAVVVKLMLAKLVASDPPTRCPSFLQSLEALFFPTVARGAVFSPLWKPL